MMKKQICLVILFSLSFYAKGSTKMNGVSQGLGNRLGIVISDPPLQVLGLEVADLTEQEKKIIGMQEGIKVTHITQAKKNDGKSIRKDFIILSVNNIPVTSKEQFLKIISIQNESIVMLEGVYLEEPSVCYYYAFEIN